MRAAILAGGRGTRLHPLVQDRPKPMVELAGRPFLEYLILQLRRQGFRQLVVCSGYRASVISDYFGNGDRWDVEIAYSTEPLPLGTGGALRRAVGDLPDERWLVMNGDSFFDAPLDVLVAEHTGAGAAATLALARVQDSGRFGRVHVDGNGWVTQFIAQAMPNGAAGPSLINGGIYVVERSVIDAVPADTLVSLEHEVFSPLVGRGLRGVTFDRAFVDIGVPDDYLRLGQQPELLLKELDGG
jgi:NDP-sugar pyrophosphorylase family protein